MKKLLSLILAGLMLVSFFGCNADDTTNDATSDESSKAMSETASDATNDATGSEESQGPNYVSETANIKIEGIYVDDSYRDSDNNPLRMVYLFYTLTATNENLKIDSKYTNLKINDNNSYESEHVPKACKYMDNFYYSSYIEDVYVGSSLKVVATFKIPEGDLTAGKTITFSDNQLPNEEELLMKTDDIVHCNSIEEIAKLADKEGYENEQNLRAVADSARTKAVKEQINGYYWTFYVNYTKYEMEFYAENNFEVRTPIATNSGTYSVRNGYIFCTYSSNGYVVEVPYEIKNGEIDLDVASAFDVMEG